MIEVIILKDGVSVFSSGDTGLKDAGTLVTLTQYAIRNARADADLPPLQDGGVVPPAND